MNTLETALKKLSGHIKPVSAKNVLLQNTGRTVDLERAIVRHK